MVLVMVTAPVAPDTLMPLPATLEVTPLLVMASGPPKICRVELSSDMPVPAVTMPVVEATIKPSESVESAAFLVLVSQTLFDALSCVVDAVPKFAPPNALSTPEMVEEALVYNEVPVALRKSKSVRWEVELAVNPLVNCKSVVVELVLRPYCVPGVKGNICASELLEILLLKIV